MTHYNGRMDDSLLSGDCETAFSVYLNINQLDTPNFIMSLFQVSTCFEHHVLIIRMSKLYYTVSGIITPIGGLPVHRLREFISCLYMFRAHVLIVRRSKLYYTASGIITPVGGRPVHSPLSTCTPDGYLQV